MGDESEIAEALPPGTPGAAIARPITATDRPLPGLSGPGIGPIPIAPGARATIDRRRPRRGPRQGPALRRADGRKIGLHAQVQPLRQVLKLRVRLLGGAIDHPARDEDHVTRDDGKLFGRKRRVAALDD
jgi:hypothetical protein